MMADAIRKSEHAPDDGLCHWKSENAPDDGLCH